MVLRTAFAGLPILITLGLTACTSEEPTAPAPRIVRAIQVSAPNSVATTQFSGVTAPVEETVAAFRVTGQIDEILVDVGDEVQAGDVIARLDASNFELAVQQLEGQLQQANAQLEAMITGEREEQIAIFEAQLAAAQAMFDRSQSEFERFEILREDNTVSESEFETVQAAHLSAQADLLQAQSRLAEARSGAREEDVRAQRSMITSLEAQLETAQNSLRYATLRAPFSGLIAERMVEPHEQVSTFVGTGSPVVVLQDISQLEITIGVPEDLIHYRGDVVSTTVALSAVNATFEAEIVNIGIDTDSRTRTYPVTVRFDNPLRPNPQGRMTRTVLPGMTGEVTFGVPEELVAEGSVSIPLSAVFERPDGSRAVWVVEDGVVHMRPVEIGRLITGDTVRATDGFASGEWVVTAGVHTLQEGQAVRMPSRRSGAGS